jgi:hypothetical protein
VQPTYKHLNDQTFDFQINISTDQNPVDNFAVTRHRPEQFADTQANAFVLKIFPPHILKNNFSQPTLAHLGFAPPHKPTQKQTPKEPIFRPAITMLKRFREIRLTIK